MTTILLTKERPILMHARSIKGIQEGRKTQTRRIIKPQPKADAPEFYADKYNHGPEWAFWLPDHRMSEPRTWKCPYGQPGDRIWIRETFFIDDVRFIGKRLPSVAPEEEPDIYYRADGEYCDQIPECCCAEVGKPKWRPAIFMPRWASRLTLEITNIQVERVQDMPWQDAIKEGVVPVMCCSGIECGCQGKPVDDPTWEFQTLWNDTNGKGAWERNDWCWVVEFRAVPA